MDSEVFVLHAHLIFFIEFLHIIVYNGKYYIFIKAIKQSSYTPCLNRHVQRGCLWPSLLSGPLEMSSVDFIVTVVCSLWPFLLYLLLSIASPMAAARLSHGRFRFGC